MKKIELNAASTLRYLSPSDGKTRTIPARVPGNVLGDLEHAGEIPDPYLDTNSIELRPYEFIDWEYRTVFPAPVLAPDEELELFFEGIDTVADILLNGRRLGSAKNMVIPHHIPVKPEELQKDNTLTVKIRSSVNYARQCRRPPYCVAMPWAMEGLFLRRPMHTACAPSNCSVRKPLTVRETANSFFWSMPAGSLSRGPTGFPPTHFTANSGTRPSSAGTAQSGVFPSDRGMKIPVAAAPPELVRLLSKSALHKFSKIVPGETLRTPDLWEQSSPAAIATQYKL